MKLKVLLRIRKTSEPQMASKGTPGPEHGYEPKVKQSTMLGQQEMSDQPCRGLSEPMCGAVPIDDPVDLRTATTGPRSSDPRDKRMPR
ncbi:Uncharacterised protein [Mycobacteroides abscessus subsp. abscessus]|nr:Uncharacterised protein [Mycobacteroides abscessus subsp. abscessus]SIN13636.1 Uncharacterised protein [Mycobacteroides abscessus subsp. abscessus]